MKLLPLLLFLIVVQYNKTYADIPYDKKEHLVATSIISSSTYLLLRSHQYTKSQSYVTAIMLTTAVGITKEIHDPFIDKNDLKYDAIGAFAAPILFINY